MRPPPLPDQPIRWRSRPLLLVAACFALGVGTAATTPEIGWTVWLGLGGGALGLAVGAALVRRQRIVTLRRLGLTVAVGLAFIALGGMRMAAWGTLPAGHVAHLAAEADRMPDPIPLTVSGTVAGPPSVTGRRVQLVLAADSVGLERLEPTTGQVQVTLWQPRDDAAPRIAYPAMEWGDRVRVVGLLRAPPGRRNPADFDYGAYLRRQGVHALLSASDAEAVQVVGSEANAAQRAVTAARAHVRATLDRHVPHPDARAVLAALLLADRGGLDGETQEAFRRTGLAHLLAVSGLHVFLVGMVLYGLLKPVLGRLGWRWRRIEFVRAGITLVLVAGYVAVAGAPHSAVRALVMAALLVGGRGFERPSNALNALGVAALVLLLARPAALFDAGFQLSFAAVGGIVTLMPVLQRPLPERWMAHPRVRTWIIDPTLVSLAATLATLPVVLVHFGRLATAGVGLNVVAIPITAAALMAALLAVVCGGWVAGMAGAFGAAAGFFVETLLAFSAWAADGLGWTAVEVSLRSGWTLGAVVLGIVAVALWPLPRHRWRTTTAALAFATVGVGLPIAPPASTLDVVFLDVGQGDAALLSLPNGRHVLVDAGPRTPYSDAGERAVLPHLRHLGIDRLDAVVVTHPHADHLGGVPALMNAGVVHRVIHNGDNYASELHAETEGLAEARGVRLQQVAAGDTLTLDPSVRIHVLHAGDDSNTNDGSVVLRVTYGETAFLLTGDAEAAAEAAMVARYGDLLRADVVKVPHHGSTTSSTPAFVEAVTEGETRFAVVSVARRNRHGLPDAEALMAWADAGAEVLQTADEGAVWLRSDGRSVKRVDWR